MKNYFFILLSILIVLSTFIYIKYLKNKSIVTVVGEARIGSVGRQKSCAKHPNFLNKLKIPQPIAIDLSQKEYKGLAFLYGKDLAQALHLKTWEKFDYFSTYVLDSRGNMYLAPMPFISVNQNTFEFQKNIYILDTNSGKLSIWMTLADVQAGANNPFGVISLAYDCDDNTLWVSAIDETNYEVNRGTIYHIDMESKKVLNRIEGIDALSLKLVKSDKGKYLLFGGARENALYGLDTETLTVIKLFELPNIHEHIRKIKVRSQNLLLLQTVPFSYTLIAESSEKNNRGEYFLKWYDLKSSWSLIKY